MTGIRVLAHERAIAIEHQKDKVRGASVKKYLHAILNLSSTARFREGGGQGEGDTVIDLFLPGARNTEQQNQEGQENASM